MTHTQFRSGLVPRVALTLAAGAALILAACNGGEAEEPPVTATEPPAATATPTATPEDPAVNADRPPDLVAEVDGTETTLGLGTYCFGGLCVDAIGIITPPDALEVDGDATLQLEFAGEQPDVTGVSWQLFALGEDVEPVDEGPYGRAWRPEDEVASGEGFEVPLDLEPGRYLLAVFVGFQPGGDASYGLVLEVTE